MGVQRLEIGLVSVDGSLADFFSEVFGFERLATMSAGPGEVHRLQGPGLVIKVMVPSRPPATSPEAKHFFSLSGLRYLTFFVDDLDGVLERAATRGGELQHGPTELGPGVRLAVLKDPDGNTLELIEGAA